MKESPPPTIAANGPHAPSGRKRVSTAARITPNSAAGSTFGRECAPSLIEHLLRQVAHTLWETTSAPKARRHKSAISNMGSMQLMANVMLSVVLRGEPTETVANGAVVARPA